MKYEILNKSYDIFIGKKLVIYEGMNEFKQLIIDCKCLLFNGYKKLLFNFDNEQLGILEILKYGGYHKINNVAVDCSLIDNNWFESALHKAIISKIIGEDKLTVIADSTDYTYGHSTILYQTKTFKVADISMSINIIIFHPDNFIDVLNQTNFYSYYD